MKVVFPNDLYIYILTQEKTLNIGRTEENLIKRETNNQLSKNQEKI